MRRPRRFWLNLLFAVAPPLVLLLGGNVFLRENFEYLNSSPRLSSLISSEITQRLGREVRVGSVLIADNWWKIFVTQKMELRNVSIADSPASPDKPFAQIDRVDIDLNLSRIFYPEDFQTPYLDRVTLIHPQIKVLRELNGRWNFDQLLKPAVPHGRPTVSNVAFKEAAVAYSDRTFPHLPELNRMSFASRLEHTHGTIDIRQDGSALFEFNGQEKTGICSDVSAVGMYKAPDGKLEVKINANKIALSTVSDRLLTRSRLRFPGGIADAALNLSYNSAGALGPVNKFRQLDLRGDFKISNVSARGSLLPTPLDRVSGSGAFSGESIHADLTGSFSGIPVKIRGSALGLNMIPQPYGPPGNKSAVTLDLAGSSDSADLTKILNILHSAHIIALTPETKKQLNRIHTSGTLNFAAVGPISNISASALAVLPEVTYDHHTSRQVHLQAVMADHIVRAEAYGSFAGGSINANASGSLLQKSGWHISTHARNIRLDQIPEAVRQQLSGLGQIDLALTTVKDQPAHLSLQFQGVNLRKRDQHLAMVYARGDTLSHTFNLRELRIEDPKGYLFGSGTVQMDTKQLDLNIDADEMQLSEIAQAKSLFSAKLAPTPGYLDSALQQINHLGTETSVLTGNPEGGLRGIGYLRAKLTGTEADPILRGRASGFALEYQQLGVDRLTADFDLSRNALVISQAKANRGLGTLRFSGIDTDPFSAKPILSLTAQADKIDIADLLLTLGVDIGEEAVTGFLSTDAVQLQGTPEHLYSRSPFTIGFDMLSINGKPVRNASLTTALDDNGLHIEKAGADLAGGHLSFAGDLNRDQSVKMIFNGQNIELQTLLDTLPETITDRLDGSLEFSGAVSGLIKKPDISLNMQVKNLNLNSVHLGTLDLAANVSDSRVSLSGLQLKDQDAASAGIIYSPGLQYSRDSGEVNGEIQWTDYPIQRLREIADSTITLHFEKSQKIQDILGQIAGPIDGLLSGTYALSGTLKDQKGALDWEARDIRVNNYPITAFSGKAIIDSKSVSIAQTRLESKEAHFEVDGRDIKIEYEGNIAGDISAYNIDLKFLQQWFSKADIRSMTAGDIPEIIGKGDFGIVASGKTSSPDLEVSVNLSNVAMLHPRAIPFVASAPIISAATAASPHTKLKARIRTDPSKQPDDAALLKAQTIDHIDIYGAAIKEGAITGNIRFVKKGDGTLEHPTLDLTASGSVGFSWNGPYVTKDSPLDFRAGTSIHPGIKLTLNEIAELFRVIALNFKSDASLNKTRTEGSEGSLFLNAALKGTARKPQFSGQLAIDVPKLRVMDISEGLTDISGTLALDGNYVVVSPGFTLKAHIFKTAASKIVTADVPVTLKGRLPIVQLDSESPNPTDGIILSAPRLVFNQTPLPSVGSGSIRGTAAIELKVDGSLQQPVLGGYIAVHDAFASLPSDFGTGEKLFAEPLIDPRFRDLHLRLERNVRMVNPQLNALVRGDIGFTGSLSQPQLQGTMFLDEGKLTLPTATFTILPPGTLRLIYPVADSRNFDTPTLGLDVDLRAKTTLSASSVTGVRRRYKVTVSAHGPITGDVTDPFTGESLLALNFQSDPPDLASDQQSLNQRLTGIIGGGDTISMLSNNSGQVLASQLANAFKGKVAGIFGQSASAFGLQEISLDYDPITRLNFTATTKIFHAFYVSYYRSLSGFQNAYELKISLPFKDRYQLSFDTNEQRTSQFLLEGVFRF